MPCVYYNDDSCNFNKNHKTKGVFYGFTATYVVLALHKMVRSMPTVPWTANKNGLKTITLGMVNTAQSQPDYVQDRTSDVKNSSHFSCRYVYNSLLQSGRYANEIAVHRNTWKKWFHDSSVFKPVVPSLSP